MDADALPCKKGIYVNHHPSLDTYLNLIPYEASDLSGAFFMDETVDVHAELGYLGYHQPIPIENHNFGESLDR